MSMPRLTGKADNFAPSLARKVTTVTPVWKSTGATDPVIGNGTLTASVMRLGPLQWVSIYILMGSTTTYGTAGNSWYLTLPAPWNATPVAVASGGAKATDTGTAFHTGIPSVNTSNNRITAISESGPDAWGQAQPHVWANTDELFITIIYPVA